MKKSALRLASAHWEHSWSRRAIGIGGASRRRPSHTTGHTGPYTAVRRITRFGGREGRQAERDEGEVGEGEGQGGALADPPGAMRAAGGARRQVPPDATAEQFGKTRPPTLPPFPGKRL